MSHSRIMSITPRYHKICSTKYVKDYWLPYFRPFDNEIKSSQLITIDFREYGSAFLNLINNLCDTANETLENALLVFRSTQLATINSLSREQFQQESKRRLEEFKKQTISSFVYLIQLIRSSIQTNQLVEVTSANAGPLAIFNDQTLKWSFHFQPRRTLYTNNCSCALSNQCIRSIGFHFRRDKISRQSNITIPGLFIGCFIIDSILLSTLECFYDKKCIKLIIDNYDFDLVGSLPPLDIRARHIQPLRPENSRFYPNTKINEIFSQLFIEEWNDSSNFTSYYTRCQPLKCTYTVQQRFDRAYMLAIMLGFYGGLSVILEIVLPTLVRQIIKRRSKSKEQIQRDIFLDNNIGKLFIQ